MNDSRVDSIGYLLGLEISLKVYERGIRAPQSLPSSRSTSRIALSLREEACLDLLVRLKNAVTGPSEVSSLR
jgi:hypothetical protein